jgi:CRP-like cAMP-binding protein
MVGMKSPQQFVPMLQSSRWFVQLPAAMVQALLAMAQVRVLQTGETLFLRNDPSCGLYALVQGSIRFSGLGGTEGAMREAVLAVLNPPAWFGEVAVFDGSVRTHDAIAIELCILLHFPHVELTNWLNQNPIHWRSLALLMADKLRISLVAMEEQIVLPLPQRLARRLVVMANDYGQVQSTHGTRRCLAITQEQLAHMMGATRQTINQILNDWKTQKWVVTQRSGIEIVDLAALERIGNVSH